MPGRYPHPRILGTGRSAAPDRAGQWTRAASLAIRTHVRYRGEVTADGSPISVLRRAIRGGSLRGVEMALIDVPQLDLQDALEIIVLMAEAQDPRFDRWAARWAARATAAETEQVLALLERLPEPVAIETLRQRAFGLRQADPSARVRLGR